ncbi:pancreatic lipase-related protein 2-like [Anticarsia gemmatalis]|uniref:pancreatic lipase-related protein 2-like n=1 Tax=Anticarsia gemmatalis TaxID=129554 RepID=UPI003F75A7C9
MVGRIVLLVAFVASVSALPADPVISKLNPEGLRYDYIRDNEGVPHLVDSWIKVSDLVREPRYNPDTDNEYHLFTRSNPLLSQPLVENNADVLRASNFDPSKKTAVLIHGFLGDVVSGFNTVLVPAYLLAGDVNVIMVDWGKGAHWGLNGISSGRSVGRVLRWIANTSGANLADFHILGYSVGAHQAGIAGRTLFGQVGYITAMDPADRWLTSQLFRADDAIYTEVIHTNAGNMGVTQPLGDVDFYPNGGSGMPGCLTALCDHYRSYFYMGESLRTGGFIGRQCATYNDALNGTCDLEGTLEMGGATPKTGQKGIYHLITNGSPPFARG